MASKTAICNMALARIGIQQPIASIDESSAPARACKLFYDQSRESMLRFRPWPWAQRYETLALVVEDPNPDWSYAYRYPADYLKIYQLVSENGGGATTGYTIYDSLSLGYVPSYAQAIPWQMGSDTQGQLIFCDQADMIAYGTYNVEDTAQFSSEFADALAWKLASEIAPGLTKDMNITERAANMAEAIASRAAASAYNENVPKEPTDSSFTLARD